jgi:hypothetical protein
MTFLQGASPKFEQFTNILVVEIIRIKWDGEPSGYAENLDKMDFSLKIIYTASLKLGCYCLKYVPASEHLE